MIFLASRSRKSIDVDTQSNCSIENKAIYKN